MQRDKELAAAVENYPMAKMITESIIEDEVRGVLNEVKEDDSNKNDWWKWLIPILLIPILYFVYTNFTQKGNVSKDTLIASIIIEPAWPIERGAKDSISMAFSTYQSNGDKGKSILKSIDTPQTQYWLSEIYLQERSPDSLLLYLPLAEELPLKAERLQYLKIMALVLKNDYTQAQNEIKNIIAPIDPVYKKIYDLIIDL